MVVQRPSKKPLHISFDIEVKKVQRFPESIQISSTPHENDTQDSKPARGRNATETSDLEQEVGPFDYDRPCYAA